jgi:hypothetical protein
MQWVCNSNNKKLKIQLRLTEPKKIVVEWSKVSFIILKNADCPEMFCSIVIVHRVVLMDDSGCHSSSRETGCVEIMLMKRSGART